MKGDLKYFYQNTKLKKIWRLAGVFGSEIFLITGSVSFLQLFFLYFRELFPYFTKLTENFDSKNYWAHLSYECSLVSMEWVELIPWWAHPPSSTPLKVRVYTDWRCFSSTMSSSIYYKLAILKLKPKKKNIYIRFFFYYRKQFKSNPLKNK